MQSPKKNLTNIPIHIYLSFSTSILLSSFLLFQVQPIISKYTLPWFGGASAVWITAMLFFQILLLLGYFYVFLISFLPLKKQIILHSILIISVALSVYYLLYNSKIPVLPDITTGLTGNFPPVVQILLILLIGTGSTYFLLSTTSILLQKWFGIVYKGKSPYFFYSLSNIASLLALISYPFLVEPFFQLKMQGILWSGGFIIYSIFLLTCCLQLFFSGAKNYKNAVNIHKFQTGIGKKKIFLWILLPAISSLMLLSVTNLMTQSVASIPFLWLLPLSIYLLSFIICFASQKMYIRNLLAYTSLFMGFLSLAFMFGNIPSIMIGVIVYSLMLFSACMLCHGELYSIRPEPEHLDLYYLLIALGSAVSGVLIGIIAPLFFKGIWEIYIGFYLTFLLTIWILIQYKDSFFYRHLRIFYYSDKEAKLFAVISYPLTIILAIIILNILSGSNPLTTKVWRSFYGILSVKYNSAMDMNTLIYGNIFHGTQYLGSLQNEPTTYYGRKSGIGLAILNDPAFNKKTRMGIIGLGTGTLAAYGEKGDKISFFEINPQVIEVAKNNFTYLKNSKARINIAVGDGRKSLENEVRLNKPKYDILVIDAFSDDSIPLHLLTKEAFAVYLDRLNRSNGIIAVHISNKYIDLKPALVQLASYYHLGFASFLLSHTDKFNTYSEWVILSYDKKFYKIPAIAHEIKYTGKNIKQISLWTDNYSNLFQILK